MLSYSVVMEMRRSTYGNTMIENGKEHKYTGHSVDYFTEKAIEYILPNDLTSLESPKVERRLEGRSKK